MKLSQQFRAVLAFVLMALSLFVALPCAADAPDPTPTDLGILAGHLGSFPNALNTSAQVVGECVWYPAQASPDHHEEQPVLTPFIWESGMMSELPLPFGFTSGRAASINASGTIVGSCWNWHWYYSDWEDYGWERVDVQACMWQRGPGGWTVTLLGAPADKGASEALLINDAGQIYAETWAIHTYAHGSAVLNSGVWTELMDSYGDIEPLWWGRPQMNQNGQVLAWSASGGGLVLWTDGTPISIVPNIYFGPTLDSFGRVAGMFWPDGSDPFTAFLYQPDTLPNLQTMPCSTGSPGEPVLWLCAINDSGQILYHKQEYANGYWGTSLMVGGLTLDGSTTTIGHLPDTVRADEPPFFNANGDISGNSYAGPYYAKADGTSLLLLDGLGGWETLVRGMNADGVIFGVSSAADGYIHGVIWGTVSALTVSDPTVTARNAKVITVTVTITNPSTTDTAYDVNVTGARLDGVDTNSFLPLVYGAIKPGASKKCTLQFKTVPSGAQPLTINGTCSMGPFYATLTATVP